MTFKNDKTNPSGVVYSQDEKYALFTAWKSSRSQLSSHFQFVSLKFCSLPRGRQCCEENSKFLVAIDLRENENNTTFEAVVDHLPFESSRLQIADWIHTSETALSINFPLRTNYKMSNIYISAERFQLFHPVKEKCFPIQNCSI